MIKASFPNLSKNNGAHVFKRYVLFGLASNLTIYIIYLSITFLGMDHKLAMTILYFIGTIISYLGNKTWTFRYKGRISSSFIKFCLTYLLGYFLNLFLLFYFVDILEYPHQIVQICSVILIAVILFLLSKFLVFTSIHDDLKS